MIGEPLIKNADTLPSDAKWRHGKEIINNLPFEPTIAIYTYEYVSRFSALFHYAYAVGEAAYECMII